MSSSSADDILLTSLGEEHHYHKQLYPSSLNLSEDLIEGIGNEVLLCNGLSSSSSVINACHHHHHQQQPQTLALPTITLARCPKQTVVDFHLFT
ncbi:hypothetical protein TYRP_006378 [Tyrophagus putrescentiae]|nr:hypothetical protein TYRP_006378 [Tyrophagus putrescentiae]